MENDPKRLKFISFTPGQFMPPMVQTAPSQISTQPSGQKTLRVHQHFANPQNMFTLQLDPALQTTAKEQVSEHGCYMLVLRDNQPKSADTTIIAAVMPLDAHMQKVDVDKDTALEIPMASFRLGDLFDIDRTIMAKNRPAILAAHGNSASTYQRLLTDSAMESLRAQTKILGPAMSEIVEPNEDFLVFFANSLASTTFHLRPEVKAMRFMPGFPDDGSEGPRH